MRIAITFDDGPHPATAPRLLKGLKERGVRATFFLLGQSVEEYSELAKQLFLEGHVIGNHTYSHLKYQPEKLKDYLEEIRKTNQILETVTGKKTKYLRPPYGAWDEKIAKMTDVTPIFWTIDSRDWESLNKEKIVEQVLNHIQDEAIILFHDEYDTTIDAVLCLIDCLKEQGCQFVTIEELLERKE